MLSKKYRLWMVDSFSQCQTWFSNLFLYCTVIRFFSDDICLNKDPSRENEIFYFHSENMCLYCENRELNYLVICYIYLYDSPILFIFKFYVHTFSMCLYFHFSVDSKWVPVCFSNERTIGTLTKSFQFPFKLYYIERDSY